jgi:arylsulfatase A
VPLIANWKGTAPGGRVLRDLVDFSDFVPTFSELAGAKMPEGIAFDGHSFAPQLRGEKGNPRDWIFVQLGARWYVRDDGWKRDEMGTLFDMKDSPFIEAEVALDSKDPAAAEARRRLGAVLAQLNPAGGKVVAAGEKKGKKSRKKK